MIENSIGPGKIGIKCIRSSLHIEIMTVGIGVPGQYGRINILSVQGVDRIYKGYHAAARAGNGPYRIAITVGVSAPFGIILRKDRVLSLLILHRRFGKYPVLKRTGPGISPLENSLSGDKGDTLLALHLTEGKIAAVSCEGPECFV